MNWSVPMRSLAAKTVLLVVLMMFFSALALDIAVPAVVLCAMALSNKLVLSFGSQPERREAMA